MRRPAQLLTWVAAAAFLVTGCNARVDQDPLGPPSSPGATANPSATQPSAGSPSAVPTFSEPTTTNTLPAPPKATTPPPSTAGDLNAASLPVPPGWSTVLNQGDPEAGSTVNGTWLQARDPRYAARDVISVGCAPVTRDDYPDPVAALEGAYQNSLGEPGIGLTFEFAATSKARSFFVAYVSQLQACTDPGGPLVVNAVVDDDALIARRTSAEGDWTEIGVVTGKRLTLLILSDQGHRISEAAAIDLLSLIKASQGNGSGAKG